MSLLPLTTGSIFMTSGMRDDPRFRLGMTFLSLLLLSTWAGSGVAGEQTWSLETLLTELAVSRNTNMRYTEEKNIGLLDHTLVSSGWLRFVHPDTLIREVDGSQGLLYRMQGDSLSVEQAGSVKRRHSISDLPEAQLFADTLRALLSGNADYLRHHHRLRLSGSRTGWELHLEPMAETKRNAIKGITITGDDKWIRTLAIKEFDGDQTRMILLGDD